MFSCNLDSSSIERDRSVSRLYLGLLTGFVFVNMPRFVTGKSSPPEMAPRDSYDLVSFNLLSWPESTEVALAEAVFTMFDAFFTMFMASCI